jgi:hypothetical protein
MAANKMNIPIFYTIETFRAWKLAKSYDKANANVHAL